MSVIKVDYGEVGGGSYTLVDEINPTNGDLQFTTQNGCLFAKGIGSLYLNINAITVKDGVVIESYDTPYGTCSYSDGVITMHTTGYTAQHITGYME